MSVSVQGDVARSRARLSHGGSPEVDGRRDAQGTAPQCPERLTWTGGWLGGYPPDSAVPAAGTGSGAGAASQATTMLSAYSTSSGAAMRSCEATSGPGVSTAATMKMATIA